jgi:hypothetical protein
MLVSPRANALPSESPKHAMANGMSRKVRCKGDRFKRFPVGEVFVLINDAVIRVYDEAGNVIETHEHAGDFKEW